MNILFVLEIYPSFGGIETVTSNLANFFCNEHKVYTLSFKSVPEAHAGKGIEECFYFPGKDVETNIKYYNDLVSKLNIDCVINQGMFEWITEIVLSETRDKDVKVYSCLHGMPNYEKNDFWLYDGGTGYLRYKHIAHKMLSYAGLYAPYRRHMQSFKDSYLKCAQEGEKVILLADGYIEDFIKRYDLNEYKDKIDAIANPLSPIYSKVKAPQWEEKENIVLYVGRFSKEKRVNLLLDVWKNGSHDGWKLVIVGDGPERESIFKKAEGMDDVIFTGFEKDPTKYYQKAKILLLTSAFEGLPMCLVEGMRYGVYPLAFNVSQGVEYVLENGGGTLVPNGKVRTMAKEVQKLINDDELLKKCSMSAYEKSDSFLIERIGNIWNEMLNQK